MFIFILVLKMWGRLKIGYVQGDKSHLHSQDLSLLLLRVVPECMMSKEHLMPKPCIGAAPGKTTAQCVRGKGMPN